MSICRVASRVLSQMQWEEGPQPQLDREVLLDRGTPWLTGVHCGGVNRACVWDGEERRRRATTVLTAASTGWVVHRDYAKWMVVKSLGVGGSWGLSTCSKHPRNLSLIPQILEEWMEKQHPPPNQRDKNKTCSGQGRGKSLRQVSKATSDFPGDLSNNVIHRQHHLRSSSWLSQGTRQRTLSSGITLGC